MIIRAAGVVIVLMGPAMMGVLRIRLLYSERRGGTGGGALRERGRGPALLGRAQLAARPCVVVKPNHAGQSHYRSGGEGRLALRAEPAVAAGDRELLLLAGSLHRWGGVVRDGGRAGEEVDVDLGDGGVAHLDVAGRFARERGR